jgi:hypothetical protein
MSKRTRKTNAHLMTPDEVTIIQSVAHRVWNDVAGDCLAALADEGRDYMTRAEVMEVALDANRPDEHFRRLVKEGKLAADFLARYERLTYDELLTLVKPAFPYARYGY